jgi:hypothetical protein
MEKIKKYSSPVKLAFAELGFLLVSYSALLFNKVGELQYSQNSYTILLILYLSIFIISSVYFKKFSSLNHLGYKLYTKILINQSSGLLLFLSLVCSLSRLNSVSRLFVAQIIYIPIVIEYLVGITFLKYYSNRQKLNPFERSLHSVEKVSYSRVVMSALILLLSFTAIHVIGNSSYESYEIYELTVIVIGINWALSSSITGKFKPHSGKIFYYKISPFVKSDTLLLLLSGLVYYFGRLEESLLKYNLFNTIIVFSFVELLLASLYFKYFERSPRPSYHNPEANLGQQPLEALFEEEDMDESLLGQLKDINYENNENIHKAVTSYIADKKIKIKRYRIIYDRTNFNIELFKHGSLDILINYCSMNHIPDINGYFQSCHNSIKAHGHLFGFYHPLENDKAIIEKRMPRFIHVVYYPIHYLFKRVMPKLPWFDKIYTVISGGKNRLISRAELLGRLTYSGFTVNKEVVINGKLLFIAQKTLSLANEEYPSYGPIIKLKRTGYNGDLIRIYKFRTMYPYSEFIQKELYKNNNLDTKGKIKNDFRVNGVGRIMRRFWLDELPQLYNWIKGDVTLFGVRALSSHYLSLYPVELKNLRSQFKPGLVPPYYSDMPKTFEEILSSERNYLEKKKAHPIRTDFIYFFKAAYNILVKGARSK